MESSNASGGSGGAPTPVASTKKLKIGYNYMTRNGLVAKFVEFDQSMTLPFYYQIQGKLFAFPETGLFDLKGAKNDYDLMEEAKEQINIAGTKVRAGYTQQRDYIESLEDKIAIAAMAALLPGVSKAEKNWGEITVKASIQIAVMMADKLRELKANREKGIVNEETEIETAKTKDG